MTKILSGFALLILVLVGGYFVDDNYRLKVNSLLHKDAVQVIAQSNTTFRETTPTVVDASKAVPTAQSGNTLATMRATKTVKVSVQNPSKPFYFQDNRGAAKGFNVDFMKTLFAQSEFGGLKLDTSHVVDTYEKVPQQLLQGTLVDIAIDGLTFNDDDLNGVVYSIPYVKDFGYALIAKKNSNVKMVEDVNNKTVGVLKGDPDAMAFAKSTFPNAIIIELSDKSDESGKWINGYFTSHKVDAVIYDYPFAVSEVEGTDLQFVTPKIKGSTIEYKIGVRARDTDLLDAINSAIRKVTASDAYPELLKNYFMSTKVVAARGAANGEATYMVARGDTLSIIAKAKYGNAARYTDIQARNNLANPNFISVGQNLIIPN